MDTDWAVMDPPQQGHYRIKDPFFLRTWADLVLDRGRLCVILAISKSM